MVNYIFHIFCVLPNGMSRAKFARRLVLLGSCVQVLGGSVPRLEAQAIDDFNRAEWIGVSGEGWSGGWAWRGRPNLNADRPSGVIVSDGALWNGNSLRVIPAITEGSTGANISRTFENYGALDVAKPYEVSFQFAIDSLGELLNTPTNYFFFAQGSASASFGATTATNWFMAGFGGTDTSQMVGTTGELATAGQAQWNIFATPVSGGGASYVPTGIGLKEGVLYSFRINLDPQNRQYTVFISDGTKDFQSDIFAYHRNTDPQQTIIFGESYLAGEGAEFSIGDVKVIPEPSFAFLLGVSVLGWAIARCR